MAETRPLTTMRYHRVQSVDGHRLLIEAEGSVYDVTAAHPRVDRFVQVARAAAVTDRSIDAVSADLLDAASTVEDDVLADVELPCLPAEVWAAGVTYEISEEAREAESGMPEVYLTVYRSERPEIFFKATPSRTVGPGDHIGIRGDSDWNTPEPELGIVLYDGEIVGYTIGNDVSSRSIEGANPLYLPQAKVYDRACSIGPCVATPESVGDPHDLRIAMTIERDGEAVYRDDTSTGLMARTCDELVSYWTRHNTVPELGVLLTGTSLVPEEEFTLTAGDLVQIEIESIGTLENPVTVV